MDSMILILFICIAIPLFLASFLLDKQSRRTVLFIIIGSFVCMFISGINNLLLTGSGQSMFYITTTYTPITEELIKAIPILLFAFFINDNRQTLLTCAMAVGIGFALLENSFILVSNISQIDVAWAITRVFGAGLMHGMCTSAIGYGISFVRKKRKLFITGTFALSVIAIIYHGIFNAFVQSQYPMIGYLLPIVTYVPLATVLFCQQKQKQKKPSKN